MAETLILSSFILNGSRIFTLRSRTQIGLCGFLLNSGAEQIEMFDMKKYTCLAMILLHTKINGGIKLDALLLWI